MCEQIRHGSIVSIGEASIAGLIVVFIDEERRHDNK